MYKIIVVADAKHAKFYESSGMKIDEMLDSLESGDLGIHHGTHDPKDAFCGTHGTRSHAFTAHSDPHELDRDDFSRAVATKLDHICTIQHHNHIKEVIIVAPAKMLGDLRHHLSKKIHDIGIREVIKDLTHTPKDKIEEIVFGRI